MKRCPACWWVPTVTFLLIVRPALADDAPSEISAAQVRSAIEKGVTFLKGSQNQNGSWNEYAAYHGGVTTLCTLALLNAGVPVEDEQMRRALDYIRTLPPEWTYVTALQTMVLCMAEPKKDLLLIRRNARWLEDQQNKEGDRKGAWSYRADMRSGGDPSNSQFALLALARSRTGRRPGLRSHLEPGAAILVAPAKSRRFLVLSTRAGRVGTRQHDLRRHRLAVHRLGPIERRRCRDHRRRFAMLRRACRQSRRQSHGKRLGVARQ